MAGSRWGRRLKLRAPAPIPEEMSIDAVVGRIDQIMAMQQQLADPAAAASQSTSGRPPPEAIPGTGSHQPHRDAGELHRRAELGDWAPRRSAPTVSTAPPHQRGAHAGAGQRDPGAEQRDGGDRRAAGTGVLPATATTGATAASGSAGAQVQAMTNMANSLVGKPYVYGGGHCGWGPQSGYDCSGFVSAVLHAGGYLSQPVDTTALPSQAGMEPGPGQYVTVYDRALPGQSGHVIIEINGQFYESGGSHGAWGGGGGVEKIGTPSAAYLPSSRTCCTPRGCNQARRDRAGAAVALARRLPGRSPWRGGRRR